MEFFPGLLWYEENSQETFFHQCFRFLLLPVVFIFHQWRWRSNFFLWFASQKGSDFASELGARPFTAVKSVWRKRSRLGLLCLSEKRHAGAKTQRRSWSAILEHCPHVSSFPDVLMLTAVIKSVLKEFIEIHISLCMRYGYCSNNRRCNPRGGNILPGFPLDGYQRYPGIYNYLASM